MKMELISNLDKLHTTELCVERIKRNLGLDIDDVVAWCRHAISTPGCSIIKQDEF